MDKLISQQAAINAVEFGITYAKAIDIKTGEARELFKQSNEELRKAVERIMRLPSAEQEAPDINVGNMEDCISRKAAIDCLNNVSFDCSMDQEVVEEELLKLPPVHPTISKTENVDGAISRRAAIDAICTEGTRLERNGTVAMVEIKQWCVGILEALPPAQPKAYTKADYIMALHKEYGCTLTRAEEAHDKALEYLRSKAIVKG